MDILDRLRGMIADASQFTMLEFGACDGYHTNQFLRMLKASGKPFVFHAFEPERSNYKTCSMATLPHASDFTLWNAAVGASTGEQKFYVSGGARTVDGRPVEHYYGSSSIRAPKLVTSSWPEMTFRETTVQVTTLDLFAAEHLSDRVIDFIWADIQGAEVDLIRGGAATMSRVKYLYTEYCDAELYEGEVGRDALCAMLPGFEMVEDYGGDVLLKNKEL
jgi:FkbM family methyltransferase